MACVVRTVGGALSVTCQFSGPGEAGLPIAQNLATSHLPTYSTTSGIRVNNAKTSRSMREVVADSLIAGCRVGPRAQFGSFLVECGVGKDDRPRLRAQAVCTRNLSLPTLLAKSSNSFRPGCLLTFCKSLGAANGSH